MNKIGFAIQRSSTGADTVLTCNPGDWTEHITDVGEYAELFNDNALLPQLADEPLPTIEGVSEGTIPFLSFVEEGCLLGVMRRCDAPTADEGDDSEGADDDYIGGWMYIPRNITVTGEELAYLLQFVSGVIADAADALLTDEGLEFDRADEVVRVFDEAYPERVSSPYVASTGERYGVRKPGVLSSLSDILENRYQENYRGFRAIFLTDPIFVAREFAAQFGNFTNRTLEKVYIVIPPKEVTGFGNGVRLLVSNGTKYVHFNHPVRTKEETPLRLSLKRPPFESYRFTYSATKDNTQLDLSPLKFEWTLRVSRSMFHIFGDGHKTLVDAVIRIADEVITGDLHVKESVAQSAVIRVSAPGYEDQRVTVDLIHQKDPVEITLYRNQAHYTRDIMLTGKKLGVVTVEAAGLSDNVCPLDGYKENRDGVLIIDRFFKLKQRAIGFVIALLLMLLAGGGAWFYFCNRFAFLEPLPAAEAPAPAPKDTVKKAPAAEQPKKEEAAEPQEQEPAAPVKEKKAPEALSPAAVDCLRAAVWDKATLDAQPELAGLFDDLNHYRFARLTGDGKWAKALRETQPELYKFISEEFPDRKYVNASFLPENMPQSITVANFKTNVLRAVEKKKNPPKAPAAATKP